MPNQTIPGAYTPFDFQGARSQWGPVVDGQVIPVAPKSVPIAVPAIFGSNANEGALFVLGAYKGAALNQTDYDEFLGFNFGSLASKVNETFSLARLNISATAAISTIITDVTYKCPAYRALLKAQESGVPVWAYEFDHTPSCAWYSAIPAAYVPKLGPTHTAEIPFVFNTTYSLPLPAGNCTFDDNEVALAGAMSRAWTNMAELGNVGDEALWPQWTANASAGVNIGDSMVVGTVNYGVCAFWDEIDAESEKIVYG
jgi:carboxylesterase type B